MTANHLVSNLQIRLSPNQKEILTNISQQLSDAKLKQSIVHGIAFHHAGLVQNNRYTIEDSFRKGHLPILVTTSTLAMGVNLPAHLVIVKSTKCYSEGGYKDYDEVSIFQMIGRAGRCQFDATATALILTSSQDKAKYEQMLNCSQMIESNLHKHLTEHLNAEVVLRTITDLDVAMRWLSSTFLYVRARRSPERYKLPAGLSKEKIDKKLLEMCQIDLNKLVRTGMIKMNQAIEVAPTVVGKIMAKYYVAFDTMKLFTQICGDEIMIQILAIISKCKEFSEIYLRTSDKRCLNILNKCSKKESNRFPLTGRIKTVDMKINCIIQAVLGNLEIHEQSILCDSIKVMRNCERLARCLIEYLETRERCYSALLNTIILAKCFRVKLWENSPYLSKQLTGVGQVISTALMKAGKTTFDEIATTNPRHIEMIVGRKAPFGNAVVDEAAHLPQYALSMEMHGSLVKLTIILLNPSVIEKKSTIDSDSVMTLLVGDSDNNVLLYEKYSHSYMLENLEIKRSIDIENSMIASITANLISENWVGIDCFQNLEMGSKCSSNNLTVNKNNKQTFMDIYMNQVNKANLYQKKREATTILEGGSDCAKKMTDLNEVVENTDAKEKCSDENVNKVTTVQNDILSKYNNPTMKKEKPVKKALTSIRIPKEVDHSIKPAPKHPKSGKATNKKSNDSKEKKIIVSKSIFHTTSKGSNYSLLNYFDYSTFEKKYDKVKSADQLLENSENSLENRSVPLTSKPLCSYVSENYGNGPEVAEVNFQRRSNHDDHSEGGFADELYTTESQLARIDNCIEEVMKLPTRVENGGSHENCKQDFDNMLNSSPYGVMSQKYNLSAEVNQRNNVNSNEIIMIGTNNLNVPINPTPTSPKSNKRTKKESNDSKEKKIIVSKSIFHTTCNPKPIKDKVKYKGFKGSNYTFLNDSQVQSITQEIKKEKSLKEENEGQISVDYDHSTFLKKDDKMKSKDKLLENSKSCVENRSVPLTSKPLCSYVSENYGNGPEVAEVNFQRRSNHDDHSEGGFADELYTTESQLARIDNCIEEVMKLPTRVENGGSHENCKQDFDNMLNSSPYGVMSQKYNLSAEVNQRNNVNSNEIIMIGTNNLNVPINPTPTSPKSNKRTKKESNDSKEKKIIVSKSIFHTTCNPKPIKDKVKYKGFKGSNYTFLNDSQVQSITQEIKKEKSLKEENEGQISVDYDHSTFLKKDDKMKSKDKLLENSKSCVENRSVPLTSKPLCSYVSENYGNGPEKQNFVHETPKQNEYKNSVLMFRGSNLFFFLR